MTSAPMSDCKKALLDSKNDIAEAKKILIKKNLIFSEKKEGRTQKEGIWGFQTNSDRTKAALINLTCETDFVAKSQAFVNFCQSSLASILSHQQFVNLNTNGESLDVKNWMEKTAFGQTEDNVLHAKKLLIANTQENIEFSRIHTFEVQCNQKIGYYIHRTIADQIGISGNYILVDLDDKVNRKSDQLNKVIDNLSVHCFSNNPKFIYENELTEAEREEVYNSVKQSMQKAIEGKPEALQQKILRGAILKQLEAKEIMEHQKLGFIESDETIGEYLEKVTKQIGGKITLKSYQNFD